MGFERAVAPDTKDSAMLPCETLSLIDADITRFDRATKENGCVQVIRGLNRLGGIEHETVCEQVGGDPRRGKYDLEGLERLFYEIEPGMVLFFCGNLLRRSDQNGSSDYRGSLVSCYLTMSNVGHNAPVENRVTFQMGADDEVKQIGRQQERGSFP